MRTLAALTTLIGLMTLGEGKAEAQYPTMPNPQMNRHQPFYITSFYWHPCPYGIAGATDPYGQPVNGIGPPPFGPKCWYDGSMTGTGGIGWHRYARSPRDFFMEQPRHWR
jgi:hypothetical protein